MQGDGSRPDRFLYHSRNRVRAVLLEENRREIMFYTKYVPSRQRTARVVLGIMMIAAGLYWFHLSMQAMTFAIAGILEAVTGLIGYCPMCSIANRISASK